LSNGDCDSATGTVRVVSPDVHRFGSGRHRIVEVLIADDHAQVRAGVRELLASSDGIRPIGAASNGEEAWELANELQPDVVVMDISMPVLDGIEATRRIVRSCPRTRVVVLTALRDRERIARAPAAGAARCLLKDEPPEAIVAAVRSAAEAA
jgi:DNA-binding NarL/FixJ family response regulator